MINLRDIYNDYLVRLDEDRAKKYKGDKFFRASMAGSCFKKHLYYIQQFEASDMPRKSRRLLRLGTIVHKDFEDALTEHSLNQDDYIMCEYEVEIPKYNVHGTLDIMYMNKETEEIEIYDLKTAASYKWSKMFGFKKNRDPNPSINYELQIGTYALGIQNNPLSEGWDYALFLAWYKKDNSTMKIVKISNDYITNADEYWKELNEVTADGHLPPDELIAGSAPNVPVYEWECKYCQFAYHCDSPFKK